MKNDIANIRTDYTLGELSENDVQKNPIDQFSIWWKQVLDSQITEPNAMSLSTVDKQTLQPEARIVLMKDFNENGFTFYTNYESAKAHELATDDKCTLLFFWKELQRQVRINGIASKISEQESAKYFNERPYESKASAWASPQSSLVPSRGFLESKLENIKQQFSPETISKPPHWGGYIVNPNRIEFWQGRGARLHDRIVYTKDNSNSENAWSITRLAP